VEEKVKMIGGDMFNEKVWDVFSVEVDVIELKMLVRVEYNLCDLEVSITEGVFEDAFIVGLEELTFAFVDEPECEYVLFVSNELLECFEGEGDKVAVFVSFFIKYGYIETFANIL
jgi:hypothetical protein